MTIWLDLRPSFKTKLKAFTQFNLSRFYISGGGETPEPLIFCHFADGTNAGDELQYEQGKVLDELPNTLENSLNDYNETHAEVLVLFDDAVPRCSHCSYCETNRRTCAIGQC